MQSSRRKLHSILLGNSLFLLSFCFACATTNLSLFPAEGTYDVGDVITATVNVTSNTQAINAVSGSLSFSRDSLAVNSLSTDGSIIKFWVDEPSFSNQTGKINFEGVILNPGYSGVSGKVLTISFRVLKSAKASVLFSQGAVLANDGEGTNVLQNLNGAKYTVSTNVQPVDSTSQAITETAPSQELSPSSTTKTKVLQNTDGTPPELLRVTLVTAPRSEFEPQFLVSTKDRESGIDKVLVEIDEKNTTELIASSTKKVDYVYQVKGVEPGAHTLRLTAYDKAGNTVTTTFPFSIRAVQAPIVDSYTKEVNIGDSLVIKGGALLYSTVIARLSNNNAEALTAYASSTEDGGSFYISTRAPLEAGQYALNLRTIDQNGAMSEWSQAAPVVVKDTIEKTVTGFVEDSAAFLKSNLFIYMSYGFIISIFSLFLLMFIRSLMLRRMALQSNLPDNVDGISHQDLAHFANSVIEGQQALFALFRKQKKTKEDKEVLSLFKAYLKASSKAIDNELEAENS
jgi:hypothetical protein